MTYQFSLKNRYYITVIITTAIWGLLIFTHFHGGVPKHHLLNRSDLPAVSNWWGGILLPVLSWFLLYRIQKRLLRSDIENNVSIILTRNTIYRFLAALLFGILLSVFFSFGDEDIPGYMLMGTFVLALFFPIYRSECLLGFVIGMSFTFGAVLPTLIGSILILIYGIIYLLIRFFILYLAGKRAGRKSQQ
jgi:hypothetical protein